MGEELHAVEVQKFRLRHGLGLFGTAVQRFQRDFLTQRRREFILGGVEQRQAASLQGSQPAGQVMASVGVETTPDILEIVEIQAVSPLGQGLGQELGGVQGQMVGDLHIAGLGCGGEEPQGRIGIGAIHHGHVKPGLHCRQTADDLPADLGLADAGHAADPTGAGIVA